MCASKIDIAYIKKLFYETEDLYIEEMDWPSGEAIICYYDSMSHGGEVNKQLDILKTRAQAEMPNWGNTAVSSFHAFSEETLISQICAGNTVVIFPNAYLLLQVSTAEYAVRAPQEPENEQVVRGAHEGFVESIQQNLSLIRKSLPMHEIVVKKIQLGKETKLQVYYVYIHSIADQDVIQELTNRLKDIQEEKVSRISQIEDYIEDSVWSLFPQFMNTERPDRVIENLLEGRVALFSNNSATGLIAPVTFFSFFQSPDDYNSRSVVGSFYRLLRLFSLIIAIFLPAFYVAVVSFHSEIVPIDISKQIKLAINEIPYHPVIEAIILEIFIELIRESSIRLPKPIGQTIGIVGGLVIGDAIVSAGLVSNLMVIVVALTAISGFVIPSVEMNMSIRLIRFPFMLLAAAFGFFGMAIGAVLLYIHLLNVRSLNQPYFSPLIPFEVSRLKSTFLRVPLKKFNKQQTSFTLKKGKREVNR